MGARAVVGTDEVKRVAHTEHVGAVTRYAMGRRALDGPFASQREAHDDRVVELTQDNSPIARLEALGRTPRRHRHRGAQSKER
jgi:hypothetical protein